jgi:hypothetical protein
LFNSLSLSFPLSLSFRSSSPSSFFRFVALMSPSLS